VNDTALDTWDNSGAAAAMDNIAAIVYNCSSGAAVLGIAWGTAAAHGAAVAPTDAQVSYSLGTTEWVRCANVLTYNSAITTSSDTWDNTARSGFGNITAGFNGDLAVTEDAFNDR